MSLSADEMTKLMNDASMGRPPSIKGTEAAEFYAKVLEEVLEIAEQGGTVGVPSEAPDTDDD